MNNLKTFTLVAGMMLALSGCGNFVSAKSIENAVALCKDNGGINHLSIFRDDNVVCNNGAIFLRDDWFVSVK